MANKFCVSLTHAKEDCDRATVAFVVANAAAASDKETLVFLSTEGVRLSQKGYADDVHGWSFLGGPDGRNLEHDTYELARLVALCRVGTPDATYGDCPALEAELDAERAPLAQQSVQLAPVLAAARAADARLTEKYGEGYSLDDLDAHTWVLAPKAPSRDCVERRIAIGAPPRRRGHKAGGDGGGKQHLACTCTHLRVCERAAD